MVSLKIAWRNIAARPTQTLVTALVVALAIALFVAVALLHDALERGVVRASDPFGVLVVGAKGSAQQLVLSTLLLQGNPVGNIPAHIYEELVQDMRVALAVPIAMGDNVGGARIIGTNAAFFELRPSALEPPAFRLADGALFDADFEAVLGSSAARRLGLAIGDQFAVGHGVTAGLESDTHGERHTVVGVLQPSHTPFDSAVFTSVDSVVAVHAGESGAMRAPAAAPSEAAAGGPQLTAVLVQPVGFVEQGQLWQEFYTGAVAQAAFPGRELGSLFDLLNQTQVLLRIVGYLAAGMAALTLFLAVYSTADTREHLLAILRGLGAKRATILQVVLWEALLAALLGALVGRLLGYGAAAIIAARLAEQAAIPMTIRFLPSLEPLLWLLPLALGLVAGLVPALQAYRVNVVEKLFPT